MSLYRDSLGVASLVRLSNKNSGTWQLLWALPAHLPPAKKASLIWSNLENLFYVDSAPSKEYCWLKLSHFLGALEENHETLLPTSLAREDICLLTEPGLSASPGEESRKAGLDSSRESISSCCTLFHPLYLGKLFLISGSRGGRQKWVHPFLPPPWLCSQDFCNVKGFTDFSAIKILCFLGGGFYRGITTHTTSSGSPGNLLKCENFSGPTKDLLTQNSSRAIKVI